MGRVPLTALANPNLENVTVLVADAQFSIFSPLVWGSILESPGMLEFPISSARSLGGSWMQSQRCKGKLPANFQVGLAIVLNSSEIS